MEPTPAVALTRALPSQGGYTSLGGTIIGCPLKWCAQEGQHLSGFICRCSKALEKMLPEGRSPSGNQAYPPREKPQAHNGRPWAISRGFPRLPTAPQSWDHCLNKFRVPRHCGCFVAGVYTPLHAIVHGREVQSVPFHCGAPMGASSAAAYHLWCTPCAMEWVKMVTDKKIQKDPEGKWQTVFMWTSTSSRPRPPTRARAPPRAPALPGGACTRMSANPYPSTSSGRTHATLRPISVHGRARWAGPERGCTSGTGRKEALVDSPTGKDQNGVALARVPSRTGMGWRPCAHQRADLGCRCRPRLAPGANTRPRALAPPAGRHPAPGAPAEPTGVRASATMRPVPALRHT